MSEAMQTKTESVEINKYDVSAVKQALAWKVENARTAGWENVPDRFESAHVSTHCDVATYEVSKHDLLAIKQAVADKAENARTSGWGGVAERIQNI